MPTRLKLLDEHFTRPSLAASFSASFPGTLWSKHNVAELKKRGVKEVGLARGRAEWKVSAATTKKVVIERAQVEGGIGTVKCAKYGFNRPAARSTAMMGACGQRAVLGFNLNKLIRELAARNEVALVG